MDTDSTQPFSEELKQYFQILWRWSWLLILFAIIGGASTYIVSIRQPKVYQATATVLVDQQQSGTDYYYVLAVERLVQSFTKLMVQQPTLEKVIEQLELNISVEQLKRSIQVKVIPDTQLLEIKVDNNDPEQAARIVNTIGSVFAEINQEQQASRYLETKSSLEAQLLSMDNQIEITSQALFEASKISETDAQREMLQVQLDEIRWL
jgi:capsular polysaccharide biosynthesis protein